MENYFSMNLEKQEIDAISNLGLAHMGDCVFEILCRGYLCAKGGKNVGNLHRDTINLVKAQSQAKFVDKLLPLLTEEERTQVFEIDDAVLYFEFLTLTGLRLSMPEPILKSTPCVALLDFLQVEQRFLQMFEALTK